MQEQLLKRSSLPKKLRKKTSLKMRNKVRAIDITCIIIIYNKRSANNIDFSLLTGKTLIKNDGQVLDFIFSAIKVSFVQKFYRGISVYCKNTSGTSSCATEKTRQSKELSLRQWWARNVTWQSPEVLSRTRSSRWKTLSGQSHQILSRLQPYD